jgi:hypothetical protein
MAIDVGALEGLAERVAWVLEKQGKRESIIHTFDNLVETVPLPDLKERMAYLKCLWLSGPLNDEEQAKKILSEWPTHEKIRDFRLLQIWFELRADSLSPLKRIAVVNRIIELSESALEKLQYSTVRTMVTVLIGESEEAKRLHTEALNSFLPSAAEVAEDGDFYASSMCAGALEIQGMLNHDKIAFERALGFLEKVNPAKLTANGAGKLNYEKGRLNWLKGDSLLAAQCFTESYKCDPMALPLIYRLDAYVRADELEKAKQDLATLRNMSMQEDLKLEFLRSAAGFAVKTADAEAARNLVKELKKLDLDILNFRVQRDELCVELLEFAAEQTEKKTTAAKRQTFMDRIREGSEYLHLKPNMFGIGLNLNKFFERKTKE